MSGHYNSSLLRLLWNLIESHAPFLRSLNDEAIGLWLLETIQDQACINSDDTCALRTYVSERSCLIRDMVEPQTFILL
ncbi:hypothetical protein IQ266_11060 [filamentous cyanobacterium LEGE 11480]|uniref:Uncharacterized protein n=1 Tax=Romeriopsis navalis LEGE 11480 TaxID=2777977 RepID=A0A928VL11_9CYAN|nr:hypothetical protein [Romeriopsis navalis]MBE9030270.1 hypothetical protein [Romeriopsis navalis LEGE 11480]